MAAIKSFTDLSQSKKLAEFLPLESADMCYIQDLLAGCKYGEYRPYIGNLIPAYGQGKIRCWSLAALLNVLPNNENINTNLSKGGYRISTLEYTNSWFVDYEDETNGLNNCVTSADNPIDACVAMIEKLHELKML
jgi:hypothetical protein